MVRTASKAIILKNGNLVAIKKEDEQGYYYILPGGGQEQGENLHENLRRECLEEIGVEVDIHELVFVRDYVGGNHGFDDNGFHQLDMMFLCTIKEGQPEPSAGTVPDDGQVGVEWLPVETLKDYRVYPITVRDEIMKLHAGEKPEKVYLGDVN
ncbi:NUDIX domain-containing protein [Metabacillus indicus]|uniref:NUDIX domain-containing protein n=1 Tax=Metabacillus indicus TaxID=246786 RepID=UPI003172153E